jgi:hypothetical protein
MPLDGSPTMTAYYDGPDLEGCVLDALPAMGRSLDPLDPDSRRMVPGLPRVGLDFPGRDQAAVGSSPIDRQTSASDTDAMSLMHTLTGLLAATTIAVSIPAGTAGAAAPPVPRRPGNIHGCGVLAVPAHPWRSHVDGGTDEAGDHWIVDAQGAHWSCSFARAEIQRLVGFGPGRYAGRDVGHLLGGLCDWEIKGLHDQYRPFQSITCHVPISQHRHRYTTTVQAFIDPDPTFIHAASSEVRR